MRLRENRSPHFLPKTRAKTTHRRLMLEGLETRQMLDGDSDPLVSFRLEAADLVTLRPVSDLKAGEPFALVAHVRDLRQTPSGVFSAYLDVRFPSTEFAVNGDLRHLGQFTNGTSGTVGTGMIDELGGFNSSTTPTGGGDQIVAAIPMVASTAGTFTFLPSSADDGVGHELLLFGRDAVVPSTQVEFKPLRLTITSGTVADRKLEANDDPFSINTSTATELAVLANDLSAQPATLSIVRLDTTGTFGQSEITSNHLHIRYTPPANFNGQDVLRYIVTDSSGETDSATVTIQVQNGEVQSKTVAYRLHVVDSSGHQVSAVNQGDAFSLHVTAEDLRRNTAGVFAAFTDVAFPDGTIIATGAIEYSSGFANGHSGNPTLNQGLIDEAGAFASGLLPTGGGERLVFSIPMKASRAGLVRLRTNPADEMPTHQTLVFGSDLPIDPADILYGQTDLLIRAAVTAVDDSWDLAMESSPVTLDVLGNDFSTSAGPLSISQVDTTGLAGSVTIANDGQSLLFTPSAETRGTEQFRYTAASASATSEATVTLHRLPDDREDDLLQIRLVAVDLATGATVTSVQAGNQAFGVQTWVRDLRGSEVANRGVFAAYFDLLYDADSVGPSAPPPASESSPISFGAEFLNGRTGDLSTPGLVNELGAFTSADRPAGSTERLLSTVRFQANTGRAADDHFTVSEDQSHVLRVLQNDVPNEGTLQFRADPANTFPTSDSLLFQPPAAVSIRQVQYLGTSVSVTPGETRVQSVTASRQGGTVSIESDRLGVKYTPPRDFVGIDEFTYSVGAGASAVVRVEVTNVDDAPVAFPDRYLAGHEQSLKVTAANGVLANDRDADGNAGMRAILARTAEHGTLHLRDDGSLEYTPRADFFGIDRFEYQAATGETVSAPTTVEISVSPPVARIRLAATDAVGQPITELPAGDLFVLRAFVEDTRERTDARRGVGAAYFDLTFDSASATPVADSSQRLGFSIDFGPKYQNGKQGDDDTPGLLNDLGAFQTDVTPIGTGEQLLFSMPFDTRVPRLAADEFATSKNARVNVFNVLENEQGKTFDLVFQAREAGNSPHADIVMFDPPQAVGGGDVQFGRTAIKVRNSAKLGLTSVGTSRAGGTVSLDPDGRGVRYSPPPDFQGQDSFSYTARDENGRASSTTVTVQVVDSWTNELEPLDTDGDSFVSPIDVLEVINFINARGPGASPAGGHSGDAFPDVNKDGFVTAIDVLLVINQLNETSSRSAAAEAEAVDTLVPVIAEGAPARQGPATAPVRKLPMTHRVTAVVDRPARPQGQRSTSPRIAIQRSAMSELTPRDLDLLAKNLLRQ